MANKDRPNSMLIKGTARKVHPGEEGAARLTERCGWGSVGGRHVQSIPMPKLIHSVGCAYTLKALLYEHHRLSHIRSRCRARRGPSRIETRST